jgi:hypothetical protein
MESKALPRAENVWVVDRASLSIRTSDDLIYGELPSEYHEHRKFHLVTLLSPAIPVHDNANLSNIVR